MARLGGECKLSVRGRAARIAVLIMFVTLTACSQIIPEIRLRDDYTGKSILQPGKVAEPVRRDQEGEPVLEETLGARLLRPFRR